MRWLRALVRIFLPCRHEATYRERRRTANGVDGILHLVCEDCGFARPTMDRSAKDHKRVLRATTRRPSVQREAPAKVTPIAERRR